MSLVIRSILSSRRLQINFTLLSSPCRETRLTEALDNVCERILQYNIHSERPGSLRYAKVKSASQVLEYLQKSCSGKRPTSLFLCAAGYESDHDNSEEPGQQRSEGGTRSAVRAVGRTVCRGDRHEEAGRAQHLLKVDVLINADLSVVFINLCVVSVRRCWSTMRRWWRTGTSIIRTRGWRTSSVRITSSRHQSEVDDFFS